MQLRKLPLLPDGLTPAEQRLRYLAQLERIAVRLPNGLLHRLVEDAQFFHDWNMCKRSARRSSRIDQTKRHVAALEDRQWKQTMKEKGL
jgi:hypothetical protein